MSISRRNEAWKQERSCDYSWHGVAHFLFSIYYFLLDVSRIAFFIFMSVEVSERNVIVV